MNNWLSFILGIISSVLITWLFFLYGNVSDLEKEIRECQYKLTSCESESKIKDKLRVENDKLQVDIEYKVKEIDLLEQTINKRNERILVLDNSIKQKDNEIQNLYSEIKDLVSKGLTEKAKKEMDVLNHKIKTINTEKSKLLHERSSLNEEILSIKQEKIKTEKELEKYRSVVVPDFERRIKVLESEIKLARKFKEYLNIRADITGLNLNFDENEISFNINFTDQDYNYLKNKCGLQQITLLTSIENKSKGVILQPNILNFEHFTVPISSITNPHTIKYPVKGYELKRNHKKRRFLKSDKGDDLVFNVVIEELNRLNIVNQKFNIRS